MDNLQDFLTNKRKEMRLSLRSAGELIGISHSYLSTLEKGQDLRNNTPVKPTPETLQLISKAYGVSYKFLMRLSGYLTRSEPYITELSVKDGIDIAKIAAKLREQFNEDSEGFLLSGEALSKEAIECILDTLEFGIHQAKVINKKYAADK